jgi:CheY-like chemotaxis protein
MPKSNYPPTVAKHLQSQRLILVVDDDRDVLQVTAEMVRQIGHCVVTANSGQEALTLLERAPAVVVLDYAMPAMTGLQTATAMRSAGFNGPIILATGYAELGEADQLELDSLQGILNKPYTIRELEILLARIDPEIAKATDDVPLQMVK